MINKQSIQLRPEEAAPDHVADAHQPLPESKVGDNQTETPLEQAIRILFCPGDLVEMRGKLLTGRCQSKFYSDHQRLAHEIEIADKTENYEALWCTLQRLKPTTLDTKQQGESTGRADIQSYEWLVVDIDRPAGDPNKSLNATDEELTALKDVAKDIVDWLKKQGFPSPIFACSGNGWHLLYKLPSLSPSWYDDLKDVLKAVAQQFDSVSGKVADGKICQIDTSLAEPEQVCKIYGTTSRKSSSNAQPRPWRESYIEYVPDRIVPVSEGILYVVASLAPLSPMKLKRSKDGVRNPDWHPYHLFDWSYPFIVVKEEYTDGDVQCFVAETCCLDVDDPLHVHKNRTVYRFGDTFGVVCFADQCEGKTIADVLHNLALLKGERYPCRIWLDDDTFGGFAEVVDDNEPEPLPAKSVEGIATPATLAEEKNGARFVVAEGYDSKSNTTKLVGIYASNVSTRKLEWLWQDRIPRGKVTLYTGKQDNGKSMATVDLIASTTTGADWPDGAKNELGPRKVILAATEDDLNDTLVPRLKVAGANLANIIIVEKVLVTDEDGKSKRLMQLKEDYRLVQRALEAYPDVVLLVLDPLTSYLGKVDQNKDSDMRPLMDALADSLRKSGAAFVGIMHHNKKTELDAVQKVQGASAIVGSARTAWGFSRDKEIEGEYFMTLVKGNINRKRTGMKYKIEPVELVTDDGKTSSVGRIVWLGECKETADELAAKEKENKENKEEGKFQKATQWLRNRLKDGDRVGSDILLKEAEEAGHSKRTMWRAKKELGIKAHTDPDSASGWAWTLPLAESSEPCVETRMPDSDVL